MNTETNEQIKRAYIYMEYISREDIPTNSIAVLLIK